MNQPFLAHTAPLYTRAWLRSRRAAEGEKLARRVNDPFPDFRSAVHCAHPQMKKPRFAGVARCFRNGWFCTFITAIQYFLDKVPSRNPGSRFFNASKKPGATSNSFHIRISFVGATFRDRQAAQQPQHTNFVNPDVFYSAACRCQSYGNTIKRGKVIDHSGVMRWNFDSRCRFQRYDVPWRSGRRRHVLTPVSATKQAIFRAQNRARAAHESAGDWSLAPFVSSDALL